jgi:hypothetical protein
MAQAGTGKRYGAEDGRGELSVWGGIASARLSDYAGALETSPQAILDAVDAEGIDLILDTAEKGQASDRERPTSPELRCLAFTREDFRRLVEAVAPEAVSSEAVAAGGEVPATAAAP